MLLIVIVPVWALVRVIVFCPPRPPTGTKFQFRDVGATVADAKQIAAWDAPSPMTATVMAFRSKTSFAGEDVAVEIGQVTIEDKTLPVAQKTLNRFHIWPQDSRRA
jgi:hypothetical protein